MANKPEASEEQKAVYQRIDKFNAHLDVCVQCENHPFDLCPTGAKLLREAATGAEKASLTPEEILRASINVWLAVWRANKISVFECITRVIDTVRKYTVPKVLDRNSSKLKERLAEGIYTNWNKSDKYTWETLPKYRKDAYREWVGEVFGQVSEEE